MSRIEEALEKAARLRTDRPAAAPVSSKPAAASTAAPSSVHLPPPYAGEAITITNELLVAAKSPHTPIAEEYRKLKSTIVKLTKSESLFRNMLMVTSAVSNEGKSITSLNLAMTLAQEYDHTVLLVDADIRKPSLHLYMGIEPEFGLSDCLMEGRDIREALIPTGIGKLSLLPAGRALSNPAELFSSQRVRDFFLEMKYRYPDRYVIIDTPPVLPFSESRSISSIVDGVIMVAKEGVVSLHSLNEAMECLKGSSILGIVYNQATVATETGYQQYYRQGYA